MKENGIADRLFRPFKFIAGTKALVWGIITIALLSVLGYLSNTHFDGIADVHIGGCPDEGYPYIIHAFYQLLTWILLTVVFYITARIVTKTAVRLIDIAGTMALSQAPLLIAAVIGFIPALHICIGDFNTTSIEEMTETIMSNIVPLLISALFLFIFVVWSMLLKYNAYSVSANVKGTKGIVSFIVAIFICEIISKVLIYYITPLLI